MLNHVVAAIKTQTHSGAESAQMMQMLPKVTHEIGKPLQSSGIWKQSCPDK